MLLIKLVLYSLIGFIIASFVHELGHLCISLICKWEFSLLIIGPLRLERDDKTKKIIPCFERNLQYWGGVSSAIPKDKKYATLIIWKLILIFGPLTSLIFSIMLFPLFVATKSYFLLLLIAQSFGMGLICILPLPIRTGILFTDGCRFWKLISNGTGRQEEETLFNLSIMEVFSDNINLSYVKSIIKPLLTSNDSYYRYYANYYLYKISEGEDNTSESNKYLNEINNLSDKVPKHIRVQFPT